MKAEKQLTTDQAFLVSLYFSLSEIETEYFIALVELDRTGLKNRKESILKRLLEIRTHGLGIVSGDRTFRQLSSGEQFVFYSQWYYSAIRLLCSLKAFQVRDGASQIAGRLELPVQVVQHALNFLTQVGLCEEREGIFYIGTLNTAIDHDSKMLNQHQSNWRLRALDAFPQTRPEKNEYFVSAPMAVDLNTKNEIAQAIRSLIAKIKSTPPQQGQLEHLVCLNIDWFEP